MIRISWIKRKEITLALKGGHRFDSGIKVSRLIGYSRHHYVSKAAKVKNFDKSRVIFLVFFSHEDKRFVKQSFPFRIVRKCATLKSEAFLIFRIFRLPLFKST